MSETSENMGNQLSEMKAILLIFSTISLYFFSKGSKILILTGFVSLVIFLLSIYIRKEKLKLAKTIFYLGLAFFNIASIGFLLEKYIFKRKISQIYTYIYKVFIVNDKIDPRYIIWIFALTSFLMIMEYHARKAQR